MGHRHFKSWRKLKMLTQKQVEVAAGMAAGTISKLESGAIEYTQKHLEGMADAYQCIPADLLRPPMALSQEARALWRSLMKLTKEEQERAVTILKLVFDADMKN